MPRIKPVSFHDLVSPLSQGKILLLLEVIDPLRSESLECAISISSFLGIKADKLPNDYEEFVSSGFMTIERDLSEINRSWAETALDFFRQKKVRDAVKAYLFIDKEFIGHSLDGHTATLDFLTEIGLPLAATAIH